ncbi:MAG TPA: hypothetical protein VM324_15350 [Egibacteraceae bacterium]|jgi:hypothetical protein|nr:hypothetical protein [Egibacteraceae bacterium]
MVTGGSVMAARVVEPVLDHAAAERARLVNEARAVLLKSGGAITIEMFAKATGRSQAAVRQWVTRQRGAGALVTVTHEGTLLVPTFQLDDAFALDPAASAVVARLAGHGMSGWAVWDWFATPNTWLDGGTPEQVLAAGDSDAVHTAVSGMFQE